MKRVSVRFLDDKNHVSEFTTDSMPEDEAEALRDRIEKEHAEAGSENSWIRVGNHSIQSRQIQTNSVVEPPSAPIAISSDDAPFFRRGMKF